MKQSLKLISVILASAATGWALSSLVSAPFTVALRGDVLLGVGASLAVIGFAVHDYSRRSQSLSRPGRILRPLRPAAVAPRRSPDAARTRAAA